MKYIILLFALLLGGCQTAPMMGVLGVDDSSNEFDLAPALVNYTEVADTPIVEAPGKHPYFDDKKTLKWYDDNSFDSALKSGKHLIIEVGRKNCSLCQKFVENILPLYKDDLKDFAGVESNVDKMNSTIQATVLRYMKEARLLPVVLVVNSKGKYIGGLWGDMSTKDKKKEFKALIKKAKDSVVIEEG